MSVRLVLAKGREKSSPHHHLWVFSDAVARMKGKTSLSETIDTVDRRGKWLAHDVYSPVSRTHACIWTLDKSESIDIGFFTRRPQQTQIWRDWLTKEGNLGSYRLIVGGSDDLSNTAIDRPSSFLVLQLLSAGAEYQRAVLINVLQIVSPDCTIYDRNDMAIHKKGGTGLTQGPVTGELPPALLSVEEHGMELLADIQYDHKTGYYLGQRDSRLTTRRYVENWRVLNCFSCIGGSTVLALMGGYHRAVSVGISQEAFGIACQSMELNKLDLNGAGFVRNDVSELPHAYRDHGEKFDVVVIDSPKFVEDKSQSIGACRDCKDINMLTTQLLNPGGIPLTFSCSGLVTTDLFQKIAADAATDTGRDVQLIEQFHQAVDHPMIAACPEGLYLRGFACRII